MWQDASAKIILIRDNVEIGYYICIKAGEIGIWNYLPHMTERDIGPA